MKKRKHFDHFHVSNVCVCEERERHMWVEGSWVGAPTEANTNENRLENRVALVFLFLLKMLLCLKTVPDVIYMWVGRLSRRRSQQKERDGEEVRVSAAVMDGLLLGRQRRRGIRLEKSRWHTPHHSVQRILFFFSFPSLSLSLLYSHPPKDDVRRESN